MAEIEDEWLAVHQIENLAHPYIESFAAGQAWQPTVGELWMTTPRSVKLYDVHDVALSLASLNSNGDATGELVDVGQGRAQDFDGKDVTGKFVLASTGLGGAYAQAVQRGALGAIAVSAIGAQRTFDFPDEIVSTTVNATQPGTSAWAVSPNMHRELTRLLNLGQKVTIRSITKRCRPDPRSSTPKSPATAARRRKSLSAAISTKA